MNHKPFTSDSPFNRRMAHGHLVRTGHTLAGHYVPSEDFDFAVKLVRTCCKEA